MNEDDLRRRIRGGAAPARNSEEAWTEYLRTRDTDGEPVREDRCPETTMGRHGPADAHGTCPWCGARYTHTSPRPAGAAVLGEIEEAYRRTYDPDFQ